MCVCFIELCCVYVYTYKILIEIINSLVGIIFTRLPKFIRHALIISSSHKRLPKEKARGVSKKEKKRDRRAPLSSIMTARGEGVENFHSLIYQCRMDNLLSAVE